MQDLKLLRLLLNLLLFPDCPIFCLETVKISQVPELGFIKDLHWVIQSNVKTMLGNYGNQFLREII